jgi:hypothetical protein
LEKSKKENLDLISITLGLIIISILILVANKLLEPIKDRQGYELAGEKLSGFLTGIKNMIFESIGTPIVPVENTYSFFINLLFPFLLLCLACGIAIFVIFHLVKSFVNIEDIMFNKILSVIFMLIFLSVLCFLLPITWQLLLLNVKVLFFWAFIIFIIIGAIFQKSYKTKSA